MREKQCENIGEPRREWRFERREPPEQRRSKPGKARTRRLSLTPSWTRTRFSTNSQLLLHVEIWASHRGGGRPCCCSARSATRGRTRTTAEWWRLKVENDGLRECWRNGRISLDQRHRWRESPVVIGASIHFKPVLIGIPQKHFQCPLLSESTSVSHLRPLAPSTCVRPLPPPLTPR